MNIRKVSLNNGGFKGAEVHFLQEEEKSGKSQQPQQPPQQPKQQPAETNKKVS